MMFINKDGKIDYDYADRLEKMIKEQRDFSSYWTPYDKIDNGEVSDDEREKYAKNLLLKVYEECAELGKVIHNFSWREKPEKNINVGVQLVEYQQQRNVVLEEIVDVFKYLMNVGFVYGMTADDFYTVFASKSKINRERRKNIEELKNSKKL